MRRIIIGISGASGPQYGIRLLEAMKRTEGVESHLVISEAAKRNIQLESDYTWIQSRVCTRAGEAAVKRHKG